MSGGEKLLPSRSHGCPPLNVSVSLNHGPRKHSLPLCARLGAWISGLQSPRRTGAVTRASPPSGCATFSRTAGGTREVSHRAAPCS